MLTMRTTSFHRVLLFLLLLPLVSALTDVVCEPGQSLEQQLEPEDIVRLRTRNYPSPYQPFYKNFSLTLTPPESHSIVFLLEQFFLDPSDEMKICNASNHCSYPKFDQTDLRGTASFYKSRGTTRVVLGRKKNAPNASMPHTGFSIYVKTYPLSYVFATDCSQTVKLDDQNPLTFVVSPNYPKNFDNPLQCNYSIRADAEIRVLAFQYRAAFTTTLMGIDGNSSSLSGNPTSDEPLAFYFQGGVDISFAYPAPKSRYDVMEFFLIIEQFQPGPSESKCLKTGSYDLSVAKSVTFGTLNYGTEPYADNLDCAWDFHGVPDGHMITLDVELETEHCCDVLNVWGIDDDTSDFRGDERRQFAFAQQNTLNMTFSSDGLGTAVGFTVTVSSQDCRCDNGRKIVMDPQKSTTVDIYSAGYGNELGYCPDMDCSWIVDFPEDYILTVTPVEVDLRYSYFVDENVVTVQDAFNRTLKSYRVQSDSASSFTPVTVSTGLANINFIGDSSGAFYGEKEKARGFHFQLSLRKMDLPSNSTVIHLSYDQRTEDIDLENLKANSMYIWTVNAPATAPIFFYTMRKISENLFVDLFDGPNEFAKPLDASMYYANATVSGPVPAVRTTGNFLTIRVFAKKSFPNFKAIVSIRNHNLLGCENNTFMYASSETSGQSASLNIVPPTENVTCYVLIASSMESRNNTYGIYMTHVEESAGVSVYKHVYTNSQFLLASSFPYPHIVYDDYVTIAYNSVSKPMKLDFRTQILSPKLSYNLRTDSAGLLFSSDYLEQSNSDPSKVSQQIVLDSRNSLFKVKIDVMRPVGNGTIFFAARNENQPLEGQIVNGSSLDTSITYNATNIKITYHSTGGTGGMFIKYSSVRIVEKSAISVFGGSLLYFISAFLMFYIFA